MPGTADEGGGCRSDAVSVRSAGEAKLSGEFTGVKEVRRIALIKHFVGFRDERIEQSCKPEYGPAQNAVSWRDAEFLRGKSDKLFSCERIGRGGNMPGLNSGGRSFGK